MSREDPNDKSVQIPDYYRTNSWNRLAWGYDLLMKLALFPFGGENRARKRFLEFVEVKKGGRVLDICAGTGSLTVLLANKTGASGSVVGVDLSTPMLDVARRKTKADWVSYRQTNSENMPFKNNTFDDAFIFLGLHEMPEKARIKTLREAFRVVKPFGYLFVVDYALPGSWLMRLIFKSIVRLTEDRAAYRMLVSNSLEGETEKAGFALDRREPLCGVLHMIQAHKSL